MTIVWTHIFICTVSDVRKSLWKIWPMLIKATSDDDTPTPGYLYKEISDLSFVSSGYCTSLLSFLVDRLDKSSFHIKVKVLRIMKHVVENGHPDFKVGLRRQAAGIQNASKFSGNPGSLHGNAPYVAVRKAVMALSELLFDTEHPKSPKRITEGKVQSTAYVDPSKIQGFGNSPTHQPHAAKSLTEVINGGVEHLASNLTNLNTDSSDMTHASQYRPITGFQNTNQRSKMSSTGAYHSSSTSRQADDQYKAVDVEGNAAAVEMQADGRVVSRRSGAVKSSQKPGGSWSADLKTGSHDSNGQKSAASTDMSEKLASVAVEDWSQEIMLVEDFVSSSNAKATPSRNELNHFSKRCATSSSEKVLELLDKQLVSNSVSSVQMRALCAIEIIIREDLVAVEMAKDVLHTNLHLLIGSQDKLVQAKAKKISKQLDRLLDESSQLLQKCTTSVEQETTPASRTLVQLSPQQDASSSVVMENVNVNILATSSSAPVSEIRSDSKSLFSGMSLGQPKVELSSSRHDNALGRFEDDPFGLRSATCKVDSQVKGKPKDNTKYDTVLSLEKRSDAIFIGNTKPEMKDTSILTSLDPSSVVAKETVAKETVLDTLLDLSSTEQATLKPLSSGANPVGFNERTAGGDKMASDGGGVQTQSGYSGSQVEVESVPRTSYVDDLLATIDPLAQSKQQVKNDHSAASVQPISVNPSKQISKENKSLEELAKLYPQLSATQLSGTSAVPLSLGRKPQTKSFDFVETEEDKKEKRTNKGQEDAFGFVHDAMAKASKR